MSTKNNFVGSEAPFYEALLLRNALGHSGGADFSAIAAQLSRLLDEVKRLQNEVRELSERNDYLSEQYLALQARVQVMESKH